MEEWVPPFGQGWLALHRSSDPPRVRRDLARKELGLGGEHFRRAVEQDLIDGKRHVEGIVGKSMTGMSMIIAGVAMVVRVRMRIIVTVDVCSSTLLFESRRQCDPAAVANERQA